MPPALNLNNNNNNSSNGGTSSKKMKKKELLAYLIAEAASDSDDDGVASSSSADSSRLDRSMGDLLNGALCEGVLMKMGGRGARKQWRRRHCVLNGKRLYYFRDLNDATPAGGIDLWRYAHAEADDESSDAKHCHFKLSNPANRDERSFRFYAESNELRKKWVLALRSCALVDDARGSASSLVAQQAMAWSSTDLSGVGKPAALTVRGDATLEQAERRRRQQQGGDTDGPSASLSSPPPLAVKSENGDAAISMVAGPSAAHKLSPADIKVVRTLVCHVAEARKLPSSASCFVSVRVGNVKAQTRTVWKTREPFWGETLTLTLGSAKSNAPSSSSSSSSSSSPSSSSSSSSRIAESVSIAVMRQHGKKDASGGNATMLGKVVVPMSELADGEQHERWHPMAAVQSKRATMSGELQMQVLYKPPLRELQGLGTMLVKVVAAHSLAPKDAKTDKADRDTFVRVALGKTKFKTHVVKRNLNPVFNEEFVWDVPLDAPSQLAVTVWHKDRRMSNTLLGRVDIELDALAPGKLIEKRYALAPARPSSALSIASSLRKASRPRSLASSSSSSVGKLAAPHSTPSSPTRVGTLLGAAGSVDRHVRPQSADAEAASSTLTLRASKSTEMVRGGLSANGDAPLKTAASSEDMTSPAAAAAAAAAAASAAEPEKELGDVRIKLRYREERILPPSAYHPLMLLLMSPELGLVKALEKLTCGASQLEEVATTLARIFHSKGMILQLAKNVSSREIDATESPETIFRGNSIATKLVDVYMKMVGLPYLHGVLQPLIAPIYASKRALEVDPNKLATSASPSAMAAANAQVEGNVDALVALVGQFFDTIVSSAADCPPVLRAIFAHLRKRVEHRYDAAQVDTVRHTVVSSMLFLRFFVPAILNPMLFDVMPEFASEHASRTLTLVAKTIQNLANLVEFGEKESFMLPLNQFIVAHIPKMRAFLIDISTEKSSLAMAETLDDIWLEKELAAIHRTVLSNWNTIEEHSTPEFFGQLSHVINHLNSLFP
jgi:GTPase-activator protein for Ras-like GTPase/C2 domain/PH domain